MKILIVEDDDSVVGALSACLLHRGYRILVAQTAAGAWDKIDDSIDVVLLDLGLPDGDGKHLCGRIREASGAAILVVTARDDLATRVQCLDLGADDYLVKPYDLRELLARLNAVVRRSSRPAERVVPAAARTAITVGRVRVDRARRTVELDETLVVLTRREFDIVELLARNAGAVVSYEAILGELWQTSWPGVMRTLQVHVAAIRGKFGSAQVIQNVRGVGYRLLDA